MKNHIALPAVLLALVLSLTACQNAAAPAVTPSPGAAPTPTDHAEAVMSYSNLSDDASKTQVRQSMESAGIDTGYIDSLFAAVDDYNALDPSVLQADGFAEVPLKDLDYPGAAWPEDRDYYDANCRITAFSLMRGLIAAHPLEADSFVAYDQEVMNHNPWYWFSAGEQGVFFSLADAVAVSPTTDADVVRDALLAEWETRGITFSDGPVSLVSVILHSELDDIAFIGHCGVLVENGTQLLFLEKYGPSLPYQATLLKDREELEAYLMARFHDFYTEGVSAKPFLLENDSALIPQEG